jgi:lysophospholipase L1-like esterase
MRVFIVGVLLLCIVGILIWTFKKNPTPMNPSINSKTNTIRYVPIGDSYTIGLGVSENERWPNVLVEGLKTNGIDLELVANPAVSGFTVNDAIDYQLPQVEKLKPDVVTVLIGANDNFRQVNAQEFSKSYQTLLDRLQKIIVNPRNILLSPFPTIHGHLLV